MRRSARVILLTGALLAVAAIIAACGTQRIGVPESNHGAYAGAVLFSQRCAGCHTLSYAAAHGSAPNVRTAQANSGPNFDQRCERPIDRVLYAIENGGFSGAYMPQNIVVGRDAIDVAKFVSTYAGRQAPIQVGIVNCVRRPLGTLPSSTGLASAGPASGTPTATTVAAAGTPKAKAVKPGHTVRKTSAAANKKLARFHKKSARS